MDSEFKISYNAILESNFGINQPELKLIIKRILVAHLMVNHSRIYVKLTISFISAATTFEIIASC